MITAAHCFSSVNPLTYVDVGSVFMNEGKRYKIESTILHEKYIHRKDKQGHQIIENDIALIKLKDEIEFSDTVQPIPLARQFTDGGEKAVVSGWGGTEGGSPDRLMFLELKTLKNDECKWQGETVTPTKICAMALPVQGVCFGDSGGPMTVNGQLVGIVSHLTVPGCGNGAPDAYTRVSEYIGWIEEKMANN